MKQWLRRHWPRLRLRTILFGIFLFVAGLPGVSAVFLRVYENTLVRQTESELIAQGAAIVAASGGRFTPARKPAPDPGPQSRLPSTADYGPGPKANAYFRPEQPQIDLSSNRVYWERPPARANAAPPDPVMTLKMRELDPMIEQIKRTTLASIIIVDRNGTILNGDWKGKSYAHVPEVARAITSGRAITTLRRNSNYRPRYTFEWISRAAMLRVHHVRPISANGQRMGAVILSRSSRALFKGMYEDRGKIMLGVGLILMTLIGLTLLLHRTIAKPIEALSKATRKVAAGKGEIPEPPATAAVEIRALYNDFGGMADSIAKRSRYLRDFAAAVSHEFKTPLAGIRGAIELIEDHHGSMSAKERKQFMGNISADADRLSALVSRLLDQARADMAKPEVGASTALLPILAQSADAVRSGGFEIVLDAPDDLPPVAVPQSTMESVIVGLLENAAQAGASEATISARRQGGEVALLVADNGPGISEPDRERLFEPFFTTRRADGGTGLGLSIARSLIETSNGSIDLVSSAKGAAFQLVLPVAR